MCEQEFRASINAFIECLDMIAREHLKGRSREDIAVSIGDFWSRRIVDNGGQLTWWTDVLREMSYEALDRWESDPLPIREW